MEIRLFFKEKSKLDEGWINGGFFVIEPKFLDFIKNDKTFLEKEPLEKLQKKNSCYKHDDFWQCMDTKRDKEYLEKVLKKSSFENFNRRWNRFFSHQLAKKCLKNNFQVISLSRKNKKE